MSATTDTEVLRVPISSIYETPENWTALYNRPGQEPEFLALIDSITKNGIDQHLLVSQDMHIVSGHRRHAAAMRIGMTHVPIVILPLNMMSLTPAERIKLLAEHNRGSRHKTQAESLREAMAQVDPEAAIKEAESRRTQHLIKVESSFSFIEARGRIARSSTGGARSELMGAVLTILDDMNKRGHLPTSNRAIHYRLLPMNVRTSTYANGHIYGQHYVTDKDGKTTLKDSSPYLSKLITDARHEGLIDDSWISDETRPVWIPNLYNSPSDYLSEQMKNLFTGYFTNPHQDQDSHIEIMVEKNTIYPLVMKHVAVPMRLPINSCRGYSSGSQRARVIERFRASGKKHLTIIYAGDHDPDGIEMPKSLVKYMEADLGTKPRIIRAAVNTEQIERFNLIPDMRAKDTSTRFPEYIKETGKAEAWEIDSMDPDILISEMLKACKSIIDTNVFNAAMEQEKEDDIRLAMYRSSVLEFMKINAHMIERDLTIIQTHNPNKLS